MHMPFRREGAGKYKTDARGREAWRLLGIPFPALSAGPQGAAAAGVTIVLGDSDDDEMEALRSEKSRAEISSRAEGLKARAQEARARLSEQGMSYARAVTKNLESDQANLQHEVKRLESDSNQNRIDARGLELKLSAVKISERLGSIQLADSVSEQASAKTEADLRAEGQERAYQTAQIEIRGHLTMLQLAEHYRQVSRQDTKSQRTKNENTLGALQSRYDEQGIEGRGMALQLAGANMSARLSTLEPAGSGAADELATVLQQREAQRVVVNDFRRLLLGESRPSGSLGSLALHMRANV